jgi:hypothetical protein
MNPKTNPLQEIMPPDHNSSNLNKIGIPNAMLNNANP